MIRFYKRRGEIFADMTLLCARWRCERQQFAACCEEESSRNQTLTATAGIDSLIEHIDPKLRLSLGWMGFCATASGVLDLIRGPEPL